MTRNTTRNKAAPSASITERFALRLRLAQKRAKEPNEHLARELDVTLRLVAMWRAGKSLPNSLNLAKLEDHFGESASWFYSPLTAVEIEELAGEEVAA